MAIALYGLTNDSIDGSAAIGSSKVQHVTTLKLSQTGTVVAATEYLNIMNVGGSIKQVEAAITEAIATGADRTVTIDVQKSTGGGAFATVLSATIVFNNASVLRTISTATVSGATLADGDMLKITVAVAGSAGAQATGLIVAVHVQEAGQ